VLEGVFCKGFTEIHGWSLSTKGWSKSSNRQEKKSRIAKEQRVTAGENTHEHRYTNFCIHEFERALSRCHRPLLTHPYRWSMRQYLRRKRPAPVPPKPDRTKLAAMCVVRKNAQSSTCEWSNQRWNKRIHMMCSSTKQRTRTASNLCRCLKHKYTYRNGLSRLAAKLTGLIFHVQHTPTTTADMLQGSREFSRVSDSERKPQKNLRLHGLQQRSS